MSSQPQLVAYHEIVEGSQFDRFIADLAMKFINSPADQIDGEIGVAQKLICEIWRFDRSALGEWNKERKHFEVTHSWALPGSVSSRGLTQNDMPWVTAKILNSEIVQIARGSELPEEAATDKATMCRVGIKSMLTFPIVVGGEILGCLGFATSNTEREWPEPLVTRLRRLTGVIACALDRKRSKSALLDSQQLVALATEASELGLLTWNIQDDEMWASKRAYLLLGWPQGSRLTYELFLDLIHADDRARVDRSIRTAAVFPTEFRVAFRLIRPDNTLRYMLVRGRSHTDVASRSLIISGVVYDVTDEKLADDRFRLAMEACPTAMVMANAEGNIVLINAQTEKMFGYRREELLGQSIDMLVPQQVRGKHSAHRIDFATHPIARTMSDHGELYGVRRDGSEFRLEIGLNPIQTNEGSHVLAAITDITDRVRALEAARDRENHFRTVANSAPVLIWMSGPDKQCTFFNEGWLRFTGRTMEEELGQGWSSGVHPDDLNRCMEVYSTAFDARKEFEIEYRLRRFDGEYRWIIDHGVPIIESGGAFSGYAGSCIDITDRRRSEQGLVDANERLREANERIEKLKEQLEQENKYLQKEIKVEGSHQEIIGRSDAIRRVLMKAEQVASTNSAVLIMGETGTGKELIARAIHRASKHKDRLMVKVNCAALPATLIESELFGREKGAYTGALTREIGRFELAHGSTILLDEIGELPPELQAKLLRVLQEGEFERLGSPRTIHVDVRVIAATSRDLVRAVKEGKFREDLYYRLNVFPIQVPPLRERQEDIPLLTWHFLHDLAGRMGRNIDSIGASTMRAFREYSWPGNVRELRNLIERHLIINSGSVFEAELPETIGSATFVDGTAEQMERNHIQRVLERTGWRIRGQGGAAEALALKPTTLESRMKKLGIIRK